MIKENRIPLDQLSEKSTETRKRRAFFDVYARQWMSGILMLTDLFCLFTAILLAIKLRLWSATSLDPAYGTIFTLLAIILVLKFYRTGLYPGVGLHYVDELSKLFNTILSTFVIILAVTVILHTSLIYSRLAIILSWMFSIVFIPAGRYLVRRFLIHLGLWGVPVVIIGSTEKGLVLAKQLRSNLQHGFRPELIFCDEYPLADGSACDLVDSLARLKESARRLHLQDALILVDDLNNIDLLVDRYRFVFNRVILINDQTGKYGLNNLEALDFTTALGLQVKNNLLSNRAQFSKMIIDKLGAFFGLLLLAPFLGLVAITIKLDSPGRVFYRQARLGKGGKIFRLLKFRTMQLNANEVLKLELARNPVLKEEWDKYQKLKEDPRITRFGKFLRKFSLDELPQLWNVLTGEMSLVGPRPIVQDEVIKYKGSYSLYTQVKPGMSGLWQISGRNDTTYDARVSLDEYYVRNWSVWMDIYILLKTIKVVLWRHGAY